MTIKELEKEVKQLDKKINSGYYDKASLLEFNSLSRELNAKRRLAYLRQEIEAERISQAEIAELISLAPYIDKSDTLLLQWAEVEEFAE